MSLSAGEKEEKIKKWSVKGEERKMIHQNTNITYMK